MSDIIALASEAVFESETILSILVYSAGCVPWLVGLTAWFVRLSMRVKNIEESQSSCVVERKQIENEIRVLMHEIKETLEGVKTDVSWLKQKQTGGLQ